MLVIYFFLLSECSASIDLVIILDSSTSVGQTNFEKMKNFVKSFLQSAAIETGDVRVGLLTYSSAVNIEFHLNQFSTRHDIYTAIDNILWRYGSTNTADALQTMHETMFSAIHGDRANVPNIAIIITDGVSNINSQRTISESTNAKGKNIHIYAIGIGLQDMQEVNGISSYPPTSNAFAVKDFDELEGLDKAIFETVCISK